MAASGYHGNTTSRRLHQLRAGRPEERASLCQGTLAYKDVSLYLVLSITNATSQSIANQNY